MKRSLPWTVRHLSFGEQWPDLTAQDGVGGFFLVFWSADMPLGQMVVPSELLPIPSAQLATAAASIVAPAVADPMLRVAFEPLTPGLLPTRIQQPQVELSRLIALDRPLASLSRRAGAAKVAAAAPSISLVICTRDQGARLENCLSSARDLRPRLGEIIIVDTDPSTDATRRLAESFPEVRYVAASRQSLTAARNIGVLTSQGPIVGFTYNDVILQAGWSEAVARAFADDEVMAVTGLLLPTELASWPEFAFDSMLFAAPWRYQQVDFDRAFLASVNALGTPLWPVSAGANMAFRRDAFEHTGLFDEGLGARGEGCSDDSELWYRLLAEGHRCRHTPTAVAFQSDPADWETVPRQTRDSMREQVAALLLHSRHQPPKGHISTRTDSYGHWRDISQTLLTVSRWLAGMTYRSAKRQAGNLLSGSRTTHPGPRLLAPQIRGALAGCCDAMRRRRERTAALGSNTRTRMLKVDSKP